MKSVNSFIEALKTDAASRNALSTLKAGDWDSIVKLASDAGFNFEKDELIKLIPLSFYSGFGNDPDAGWHPNTIPEHLRYVILKSGPEV